MSDDFYIPSENLPSSALRQSGTKSKRISGRQSQMMAADKSKAPQYTQTHDSKAIGEVSKGVKGQPFDRVAAQLLISLLKAKYRSVVLSMTPGGDLQSQVLNQSMASAPNRQNVVTARRLATELEQSVDLNAQLVVQKNLYHKYTDRLVTHMCPDCTLLRKIKGGPKDASTRESTTSSSSTSGESESTQRSTSTSSSSSASNTSNEDLNSLRCLAHRVLSSAQVDSGTDRLTDQILSPPTTRAAESRQSQNVLTEWSFVHKALESTINEFSEVLPSWIASQVSVSISRPCHPMRDVFSHSVTSSHTDTTKVADIPEEGHVVRRSSVFEDVTDAFGDQEDLKTTLVLRMLQGRGGAAASTSDAMTPWLALHLQYLQNNLSTILAQGNFRPAIASSSQLKHSMRLNYFSDAIRLLTKYTFSSSSKTESEHNELYHPSLLVIHLLRQWFSVVTKDKKDKDSLLISFGSKNSELNAAKAIAQAVWRKMKSSSAPSLHHHKDSSTSITVEMSLIDLTITLFGSFLSFAKETLKIIVQHECLELEEGNTSSLVTQALFEQLPFLFALPLILETMLPVLLELCPLSASHLNVRPDQTASCDHDTLLPQLKSIDVSLASVAPSILLGLLLTNWAPTDAAMEVDNDFCRIPLSDDITRSIVNENAFEGANDSRFVADGDLVEDESGANTLISDLLPSFFGAIDERNNSSVTADTAECPSPGESAFPVLKPSSASIPSATLRSIANNFRDSGKFTHAVLETATASSLKASNRAKDGTAIKGRRQRKGLQGLLEEHSKEEHAYLFDDEEGNQQGNKKQITSTLDSSKTAQAVFIANREVGISRERCTVIRSTIVKKLEEVQELLADLKEATMEATSAEVKLVKVIENATEIEIAGKECWNRLSRMHTMTLTFEKQRKKSAAKRSREE